MFKGIAKPAFMLLIIICRQTPVYAAIVYDEFISGDLPDSNTATPVLAVGAGSNEITGELGINPDTSDSFFIDLRNGFRLDSIIVTKFPVSANGYQIGFNLLYANSLYYLNIDQAQSGVDILPLLNPLWGPGFSLPLQNDIVEIILISTLSRNAYGLDFVVSQTPLPSALILLLSGMFTLVWAGSRQKKIHKRMHA